MGLRRPVPEALTTVPKGWRLGTKDQIQGAKERFLEKAKEEFDNYADKEQHRTEVRRLWQPPRRDATTSRRRSMRRWEEG